MESGQNALARCHEPAHKNLEGASDPPWSKGGSDAHSRFLCRFVPDDPGQNDPGQNSAKFQKARLPHSYTTERGRNACWPCAPFRSGSCPVPGAFCPNSTPATKEIFERFGSLLTRLRHSSGRYVTLAFGRYVTLAPHCNPPRLCQKAGAAKKPGRVAASSAPSGLLRLAGRYL